MANIFFCSDCGFETTKWSGKCPNCGSWDTMREGSRLVSKKADASPANPQALPQRIKDLNKTGVSRLQTGTHELDLVLGGGIVPGMVVLIGGEPGIGKSTLMLQLSEWLG
ncbi:MAG: DNA repair protein RadA, partial [Candidatus Cloacimonetes bacterium]|nr:DNA repair protein RadA [Candidatus Cloacimonadota bacterium]